MGHRWGPPPDGGYTADVEADTPAPPPRGTGGVEPPLSDRYRIVCEMLALELNRPVVPENWRAQFGAVLQTQEYLRVIGVIESWPGVASGRLEVPLVGEERSAVIAAANRGMRSGDPECEHLINTGVMRCPLCEPHETPADFYVVEFRDLHRRVHEVAAERDGLRRALDELRAASKDRGDEPT